MDNVVRGRFEAVAADLAVLSDGAALFALAKLGQRTSTDDQLDGLYAGAGYALARVVSAGLARPLHSERRPDGQLHTVCGLTPRGRQLFMSLRGSLP